MAKRINGKLSSKTALLEAERAKAEALFSSIGEGAIATGEDAKITHVNESALKMLGFSRQELIGQWFPNTIIAEDEQGNVISTIDRPVSKALLEGVAVSRRLCFRRKDGSVQPVFVTASPILLDGLPVGTIEVFRDTTAENDIERAKDEFVSMVSHQLKTPVTSIRLFAEMLEDKRVGSINKTQQDYIQNISTAAIRMINLVNDILNVSRINLGRLKIDTEPTNLSKLIQTRVDETQPLAKEKAVSLSYSPARQPPIVMADPTLLGEVVHNLLTNAIRYTKPGEGQVNVKLQKEGQFYVISVADNGIGIPEEAHEKMFHRFFRAENAKSVVQEGTGLGLYLVRMIMELSGGKVSFKSKPNHGTTFYISVPIGGMRSHEGEAGLQ